MVDVWSRSTQVIRAALFLLAATPAGAVHAETLKFVGAFEIPAGLSLAGVDFGGLSSLDRDPETGRFFAISDDRGRHGPPRFYELALDLGVQGVSGVDIISQTPLLTLEETVFEDGAIDPEALRIGPNGELYWAQEGGASGVPSVGVMGRDGRQIADFALPAYYAPSTEDDDVDVEGPRGVRDNYGFESLTFALDGTVVVAAENALAQDGPLADVGVGSNVRFLSLSPDTGRPVAEHVYPVDPVSALPRPADAFRNSGLTEILAGPDGDFYTLERSFSRGQGTTVSLYKTNFEGATNVLGVPVLSAVSWTPMRKRLLFSLRAGGVVERVDNLEGMTFGPEIDGRRSLVLVSDDNFSHPWQSTQFLLFLIED